MPNFVSSILAMAEATLSLLSNREKNYIPKKQIEFAQRLNKLKTEWYEEYNRDPKTRSDAVMDHLELELRLYVEDFAAFIRSENLSDK